MIIARTLLRMALFWVPLGLAAVALRVRRAQIAAEAPPQMTMVGEEGVMGWMLIGGTTGVLLLVLASVLPRGRWRLGLLWLFIAVVVFALLSWILGTQPVSPQVALVLVMVLAPLAGSVIAEWFSAPSRRSDRSTAAATRP